MRTPELRLDSPTGPRAQAPSSQPERAPAGAGFEKILHEKSPEKPAQKSDEVGPEKPVHAADEKTLSSKDVKASDEGPKAEKDTKESVRKPKDASKDRAIAQVHEALGQIASMFSALKPSGVQVDRLNARTFQARVSKNIPKGGNKLHEGGKKLPGIPMKLRLHKNPEEVVGKKTKESEPQAAEKKLEIPTAKVSLETRPQHGMIVPQQAQVPTQVHAAQAALPVAPPRAMASTERVQMKTNDRGGDARVSLDLGDGVKLELRVQVRDGVANVVIQANRPELIDQLNTARAELAQALQSAGLDPELLQFGSGDGQQHEREQESWNHEWLEEEQNESSQDWDHIPGRLYIIS